MKAWTEIMHLMIELYDERILANFGGTRPQ
jgi:hypothetical protein